MRSKFGWDLPPGVTNRMIEEQFGDHLDPETPILSDKERDLLQWLGREDFSQYGECHGPDLTSLILMGLAQVHGPGEHQVFIARGTSMMYRAVSLTEKGLASLESEHD